MDGDDSSGVAVGGMTRRFNLGGSCGDLFGSGGVSASLRVWIFPSSVAGSEAAGGMAVDSDSNSREKSPLDLFPSDEAVEVLFV